MKPLAIDLFCGLGGWTDGLLAEGYDVVGFDIERHVYGEHRYPAQLVVQDVLTLHGSQFKSASLIVASPPCQEFSYMAMPWSKAKAIAADYRSGVRDAKKLTALFDACFRIQREACEAAGRRVPLIVENVRGAQPWIGRSRWNFGSFHLWGDVPALMPIVRREFKVGGTDISNVGFNVACVRKFAHGDPNVTMADGRAAKNTGGSWFNIAHSTTSGKGQNPDGRKGVGPKWDSATKSGAHGMPRWTNPAEGLKNGNDWFGAGENCSLQRSHGSKSSAHKFASAMIAKIPLPLSRHIARTFKHG